MHIAGVLRPLGSNSPSTSSDLKNVFISTRWWARNLQRWSRIEDFIKEDIKTGKIQSMVAWQSTSKAIQSDFIGGAKNKKEDVSSITP